MPVLVISFCACVYSSSLLAASSKRSSLSLFPLIMSSTVSSSVFSFPRQAARRTAILVIGSAHNYGFVQGIVEGVHYNLLSHVGDGQVRLPNPPTTTVLAPSRSCPHHPGSNGHGENIPRHGRVRHRRFLRSLASDDGTLGIVHERFLLRRSALDPAGRDDVQVISSVVSSAAL